MNEIGKMEEPEVEVGQKRDQSQHGQDGAAGSPPHLHETDEPVHDTGGLLRGLAGCALRHPLVPPQEEQPQQGQHQLPACACNVIPIDLGHHRSGCVHHPHPGRKGSGFLAVGGDLGNRVRAIADTLADAQVADCHASGFDGTRTQAVAGSRVDVPQDAVVATVERAPRCVGVIGVRLDGHGVDGRGRTQIPSHSRRACVEQHGQLRVPHRAFGRQGLVGEQGQIATRVLPTYGSPSGQQIAGRTGRER